MINLVDVSALSKILCPQNIHTQLKYATVQNFLGRVVNGYQPELLDLCLMTPKAARALCQVQTFLNEKYNYGILVFDAYRPKRAVVDFMQWSLAPPANDFELARKALHYPNIEKAELFTQGYVAEDSNHCYGNTVDLILINLKTNTNLEMGSPFDYMDEKSHWTASAKQLGNEAYTNRQILLDAMKKFDFIPYEKEFWHFTHGGEEGREVSEPIDVAISSELRGLNVSTIADSAKADS